MTNPFESHVATAPAETAKTATTKTATTKTADTPPPAADLGFNGGGDPFADPTGVSGEYISDFVGNLLLVKPTELIPSMETVKGTALNVIRCNLAVLDDEKEPGRIVEGVLLMQTALKREARAVLESSNPYLLGRLHKREEKGKNTLYTFQPATDDDKNTARMFLKARTL